MRVILEVLLLAFVLVGAFSLGIWYERSGDTWYDCKFDRTPGTFQVTGRDLARTTRLVTVHMDGRILMLRREYVGECTSTDKGL